MATQTTRTYTTTYMARALNLGDDRIVNLPSQDIRVGTIVYTSPVFCAVYDREQELITGLVNPNDQYAQKSKVVGRYVFLAPDFTWRFWTD
jgi:hypothetical protein